MNLTEKHKLLFELGKNRNWHPKNVDLYNSGEYYCYDGQKIHGRELSIGIALICNHMKLIPPTVTDCYLLLEHIRVNIPEICEGTTFKFFDLNLNDIININCDGCWRKT